VSKKEFTSLLKETKKWDRGKGPFTILYPEKIIFLSIYPYTETTFGSNVKVCDICLLFIDLRKMVTPVILHKV
jgi:hypothetical protein